MGRRRLTREEYLKSLEKRYGSLFVKIIEHLPDDPLLTGSDIARAFGVTREFVRCVADRVHGKGILRRKKRATMRRGVLNGCFVPLEVAAQKRAESLKRLEERKGQAVKKMQEREQIKVRDALQSLCDRLKERSGSGIFNIFKIQAVRNSGGRNKKFFHFRLPNGVSFYLARSKYRCYHYRSGGKLKTARVCQFRIPRLWKDAGYAECMREPKVVAVKHPLWGDEIRFFVFPPGFLAKIKQKSIVLVNDSGQTLLPECFENFDMLLSGQETAARQVINQPSISDGSSPELERLSAFIDLSVI